MPTLATPPALKAAIDAGLARSMQRGVFPGAVVLIRHRGQQVMLQPYGLAYKYDTLTDAAAEPIDAKSDTLYDLASISKLFTTTVVMRLVEQGKLALDEPVAAWIPEFAAGGKESVTLRHLLTHTSGLPDYLQLWKLESTPAARIQRVLATPLVAKPGSVFRYSDLGLISLGHLVQRVTGSPLDANVRDMVTGPLKLTDTMYNPPAALKPRIAPTEYEDAVGRGMVWGQVHDENAWSLDGVAGHAGVFSTASDVARFAQLYLNGGELDGVRLLRSDTVADMTRNQIGNLEERGLGWELDADYYMGKLASPVTYGHTGFTGTSLVVDPRRELIVVLLTNRVHPTRNGPSENPARQVVADAAMAMADAAPSAPSALALTVTSRAPDRLSLGVDMVTTDRKDALRGRRIGLITNNTGRDRNGASTIDVLYASSEWKLLALFSPEHGIRGEAAAGETVDSSRDEKTGLPIYSLFGQTTRPTPAMLQGLDTLVYDIQDVGARIYTYPSTLLDVMRAAAERGLRVVVLDRPNPINGVEVEGNVLDPKFTSFVGAGPIAMRYGLTIGELARFFNAEMGVGADLDVVAMNEWSRGQWFDQTGLEWVNPSPNIRSLSAATVYPGTVLFEGTTLTEGRGTDRPFEWIGAPWIDADAWATRIGSVPGVRFTPVSKTPEVGSAKFPGQECQGLLVEVVDRDALKPMAMGVAMVSAALAVAPDRARITASNFDLLAGTDVLRRAIEAGTSPEQITSGWQTARDAFAARRERYLLYT